MMPSSSWSWERMEGDERDTKMNKAGLEPSRRARPGENTCKKLTAGQD